MGNTEGPVCSYNSSWSSSSWSHHTFTFTWFRASAAVMRRLTSAPHSHRNNESCFNEHLCDHCLTHIRFSFNYALFGVGICSECSKNSIFLGNFKLECTQDRFRVWERFNNTGPGLKSRHVRTFAMINCSQIPKKPLHVLSSMFLQAKLHCIRWGYESFQHNATS